jgi:predicted dehydrogenase
VVTFANGVIATIEGTVNVYPQNLEETLYLFGETGTVKLGGKATNNIDVWQFADRNEKDEGLEGKQEVIGNVYGNGHSRLYADMLEAIRDDRDPLISAQEGTKALELILAIYKSQLTGQVVQLPLDNFASTDMTGYFD